MQRAAVALMQVCVRVCVRGAVDRRGVTTGQVEAVFTVEQHLLLVTLYSRERSKQSMNVLCVRASQYGCIHKTDDLFSLTVQGLTVRALLMKWNCSMPACREE